eukprot:XP_011453428.1 PREDICTED: uncharacterized protein LOC105346507 isoform X2 [Crassostrea gigas]
MPFKRFSRSRRQPKWIDKQILEDSQKRPAYPAKIVKHISGPLADGSLVREISDFEVYIKAVFTPESLKEIRSEYDSELDWSKALIIVNQYSVEFKFHDQLEFCEYYIRVEKFQIWDLQVGFDLKENVRFCMDNTAVQEKAKVKWKEMRSTGLTESFSLTQCLEAMLQNDSSLSLDLTHGGHDTQTETQEDSPKTSTNNSSTKDSGSLLKAVMTVEEFKISVPQQRELENIKEWEDNYIPTQSETDSPPMDIPCGQPSVSLDSPDDIQPGQPNQDRVTVPRKSPRKKLKDEKMAEKEYIREREAAQSLESPVKENEQTSPKKKDTNNSRTKDFTSEQEKQAFQTEDHQEECTTSNYVFTGGTQGFVPQLEGDDLPCTAPFSPQLSPDNTTDRQISPVHSSGDNILPVQDTSPILISSSGEATGSSGGSRENCGKGSEENQKSSSDEPQFHLSPPVLSASPRNSGEKSRESPRLQNLSRSATKSFQDYFEMMVESERLRKLADGSTDKRELRSKKRLLEDSNEESTLEKRKRTQDRKSKATDGESGEKSSDRGERGFVSNVMDKMLNFVGRSKSTRKEEEDPINIQNFSSSFEDPCEESQSLIQPSKKSNSKASPQKIKGDQGRKETAAKSKAGSVNDVDLPISISSTEEGKIQSEDLVDIPVHVLNNSERPTTSQSAMMEQDQEISSSQLPPLPKQEEPDDEIGQKLYHLKLPSDLKAKLQNYWKHK